MKNYFKKIENKLKEKLNLEELILECFYNIFG